MTLTIFGSTGKTGQYLVKMALEAGYRVRAFARTPEKMEIRHDNLQVVAGNALEYSSVREAVKGSDAVFSLIGVTPGSEQNSFLMAMQNIVAGMREEGVSRLIMSAGAGVGDPNDRPDFMGRLMGGLIRLIAPKAYHDGLETASYIRSCTDIQWSMIRVPMLSDKAPRQPQIRQGFLGVNTGHSLYRKDMADVMLRELKEGKHIHQAPVYSN
ncbi:NAD(P)-dependent oxidoreductase [Salinispira pacifica]|uniref:Flavin reductase n=1 Tax=Salinispira pacifica TaxID=1307761 RepID=V5WLC6_9SPIO|nr:NAD(P)H-binding protein [Salinispira pacifica]AHC16364.1 Flavin reductase [Salinispira pacifica]